MKIDLKAEQWALALPFTISRGSRTTTEVVCLSLEGEGAVGRGECTPLERYGESIAQTLGVLEEVAARLDRGAPLEELLLSLPAGAARNALDCAWWDWRCKQAGERIATLLGEPPVRPLTTAYTLSIDTPEAMEAAARLQAHRPLLKIKSGRENAIACVEAVRRGAPGSTLIVDANEAWNPRELPRLLEAMAALGVAFVEQPLPAGNDQALATFPHPLPVIADESVHTAADVPAMVGRYDGVNLKLDKTGGLTEALRALRAAREHRLCVLCGCMLGTSLAMAPAMILAQQADYVDLDAPLLLARDRAGGIRFDGSTMHPFGADLWG